VVLVVMIVIQQVDALVDVVLIIFAVLTDVVIDIIVVVIVELVVLDVNYDVLVIHPIKDKEVVLRSMKLLVHEHKQDRELAYFLLFLEGIGVRGSLNADIMYVVSIYKGVHIIKLLDDVSAT
jgi:hypothetical protein